MFGYVRAMTAEQNGVAETPTTSPKRVSYSVYEFADITGLTIEAVYRAIKAGEVKAVKFGALYRISRLEVERLFGVAA